MSNIDINALRSLAERLEKATGPDRELDVDICCHLKLWPNGFMICNEGSGVSPTSWQRYNSTRDSVEFWEPPAYSASIDAASAFRERLLLGWDWSVRTATTRDGDERYCNAQVWEPHTEGPHIYANAAEGQPAIAMVAATIAALIAQAEATHA